MIQLPRFTLRLRLLISIASIVALFSITNITYQVSSQNRTLRLDNLQKAVQGQLASINIRQMLENQQKEILVLDALTEGGDSLLQRDEIRGGVRNISTISEEIINLQEYAYTDAIDAYNDLLESYDELSALWQLFYSEGKSSRPKVADIETSYSRTLALLRVFESLETQAAEQQAEELQKSSLLTERTTLAIYLFTIALTVGLGYLLIRYTIRSLNELNKGTVRIGRGDLDYHIPIVSDDEIGDLTIAFNDMADKLRNAMAQVQQSKEKADQANRAKTNFLANMSHELRTPLNAIIGYSEMNIDVYREENELDQEQAVKDLQHILNSGRHLLQLINDVLDLAKIESGNMTIFNETFNSVKVIEDIVTTMKPLATKQHNRIVVEASADTPLLHSDAVKFRQVFINLLSNACKFTHNGKITILVTHNSATQQIVYHVSDTGIGMSKDELDHIFEAFVQADSSTSKNYGGTGLGLAICKDFIELMHGTLDVSSARDKGTTFTIVLPVRQKEKRRPAAIPTRNQRELGLGLQDAFQHEPAKSDIPAGNQAELPVTGDAAVVLCSKDSSSLKHLTRLLNQHQVKFRFATAQDSEPVYEQKESTTGDIHQTPGILLHTLATAATPAGTANNLQEQPDEWHYLFEHINSAPDHRLAILALFSDDIQDEQPYSARFHSLKTELDVSNRQRLAIQVRRHNPRYRRGKALLVGYPHNEDTQTSLASDLLGEAWQWQYCDDISTAFEKNLQAEPDIIFVNPEQERPLIIDFCQALRRNALSNRQSGATGQSRDAQPFPRLFFAYSNESTQQKNFFDSADTRPLEQPVIELIIDLLALD